MRRGEGEPGYALVLQGEAIIMHDLQSCKDLLFDSRAWQCESLSAQEAFDDSSSLTPSSRGESRNRFCHLNGLLFEALVFLRSSCEQE